MKIELLEVSKKFEKVQALDAVSLAVEPGQIVVILGLNGAGKTTLLRCLAGVVSPDKGELLYDGARFHRGRLDMRQRFLFLPDTPFVFGHMTVLRHLGMVLRLFDAGRDGVEDRVVEILRQLDMLPLADTQLYKLSRGQLYKAALAGLLVVDPEVWLLDEPLASGMDPSGISFFKECAREAARRGRTILYTTQIAEIAERFADRICLLHNGSVHVFETVVELKRRLATEHGVLEELFRRLREGT